jgi:hypothetical protein
MERSATTSPTRERPQPARERTERHILTPCERKEMLESIIGAREEGRLENTGVRLARYLAEFRRRIEQDTGDPCRYLQSVSYMADKIHFCANALLHEMQTRTEPRWRSRRR